MRVYSPLIKTLMSQDTIEVYILVKITIAGNDLCHTTCPYDLDIPGLGYFEANSNLVSVELPKMSSTVDREAYKITYADPEFSYRGIFQEGALGSPVSTYLVMKNTTDTTIEGVPPGGLALNDIITVYSGTVDAPSYNVSADDTVMTTLECTSPMGALDLVRVYNTSKDCVASYDATDTAYDQVYQGSSQMQFLWGKK